MTIALLEMKGRIRTMPTADLDALYRAIKLERNRRQGKQAPGRDLKYDANRQMVYDAACLAVARKSGDHMKKAMPMPVFDRDSRRKSGLTNAVESLEQLQVRVVGRVLQRPQRSKLYDLVMKLTVTYLASIPAEKGQIAGYDVPAVLRQHEKFPAMLNGAFPGYGMSRVGWQLLLETQDLPIVQENDTR